MNYYPAAKIINDTATHTGRFGKLVAMEDSVIDTIQGPNISGDLTSLQFNTNRPIEAVQVESVSLSKISYILEFNFYC